MVQSIRLLIACALALAWAVPASAQVAHDGTANVTVATGSAALSHTFTGKTTTGSDRYGVLSVAVSSPANTTGATWNGAAMTLLVSVTNGTDGRGAEIYGIANPPTGASDVVISGSGTFSIVGVARSYSGANSTQAGDTSTAEGTADPATVDCTNESNALIVDALYFLGAGTPPSVGADQTSIYNADQGLWFGTHSQQSTGNTMSWTLTSPTRWAQACVVLQPAAGGGGGTCTGGLTLLGAGKCE